MLMILFKKNVNVGDVGVFDTSLIFSPECVCLQKVRDIDMKDVMGYVPPSMFDETGEMRITKSTLKSKLQIEVIYRRSIPPASF